MARGSVAQKPNDKIKVQAPGFPSSAILLFVRPSGLNTLIHLLTLTSQHVSENALLSNHIISFFIFHKNNSASHTTPGTLISV